MKTCRIRRLLMLFALILSQFGICATIEAQQTIHGSVPMYIKQFGLHPVARLDTTKVLTVGIGLSLQNSQALTSLLRQLYTPGNPNFHHWLTPSEFTAQFAPSQADYQRVINYLEASGFKVTKTYPNRMLIDVSAPVSHIEKAFHLTMMVYRRPSGRGTFYAPDSEPTLTVTTPIVHISGLRNDIVPVSHARFAPLAKNGKPSPLNQTGSKNGLYTSKDIRAAYAPGVSLTGSGQTVGLLELDGFYYSDISSYESNTGLTNNPPTVDTVLIDQFNGSPMGDEREVSLDIEMAMAMAPNLSKIVSYEATGSSDVIVQHFEDILNEMVQNNSVKQFSSSWGYTDYTGQLDDPTADNSFLQMAADGQSFFQASGDEDAITNTTWINNGDTVHSYFGFPDDNPYVTSVGGTELRTTGPGGSYVNEAVWNPDYYYKPNYAFLGSSGGVSREYSIPSWQQGANPSNTQVSSTWRNVPDVALTADSLYGYWDSQDQVGGGTSAAAPLWAGFTALANEAAANLGTAPVGFINPAIYGFAQASYYGSDFHDLPTSSENNNEWPGSGSAFTASSGYDLCAGLGTPNGQNLIADLVYNLHVPEEYSTIASALSAAVSGQTVIVDGAQTVSSNLTVPNGVTLEMNSGATITFSGYYKLRIEGALLASGSSSSPITFQGNGSSGSWFGIEFYDVSQGSSLRYCTIKDAYYGLNLISSYVPPNPLVITNNDYGVNCTNYSDPSFTSTVFDGNNYDVYGDGTSTPLLGTSTGLGYNSFRNPGYYQVYSTYSGTISAEGNWWGGSPPSPVVTSNVDYSNWLSTDPNSEMKEIDGKRIVVVQAVSPSSSKPQSSNPIIMSSDSGTTQLDAAYRLYLQGDYENALQAFQAVVASYPDNFTGCRALVFAERCLERLGRSSDVLTELNDVSAAHTGTRVNTFAEARRTYQYLQRGMYQKALAQAVQTAGSSGDTSLVKFALYDAGSINWYDLGNEQSGEEYYRQLIARYPGDPLSASALVAMGEATAPSTPQQQTSAVTEQKQVALGNYPNPFNPTTVISYSLKTAGHVTLRVCDVVGRVVATLIDGQENAGLHSVQFDGQNLASGVYLYRLTAPGIDQVKKMILMK